MKTITSIALLVGLMLLPFDGAYAEDMCQYATSASASSEAGTGLAIYATGAPDAPYGGDCGVWSGPGYNWNPTNWNVLANITLRYTTPVTVNNITVFGDYDMCISGAWIMNSSSGQKKQISNMLDGTCQPTYGAGADFVGDTVILQTCGWSWSSTDAVRMCGSVASPMPVVPVCGNSKVESPEECDDGNDVNGDGCSDACGIEIISGTGCRYAQNAESMSELPGRLAIYAIGAPDSDGNCSTSPSLNASWQKALWNVPTNITLTFPPAYAANLTVFGDYELCINRVWLWRDDHWYLAQAGNMDKALGNDCKIDYNFSSMNFKTDKVMLETCGWRSSAIDAVMLCGSSESYPRIKIIDPPQDRVADSPKGSVMLRISTDKSARCALDYARDFSIGSGINMSTEDGLVHTYNMTGPVMDSIDVYYICASDAGGKTNPYSVMHRVRFGNTSSPSIEICDWYGCSQGAASISMDDGYQPTLGYVKAVCEDELESTGLRGTYFLGYTGAYNQSDWDIWKNAYARGHELGGHSQLHNCTKDVMLDETFFTSDVSANIEDITKNVGMQSSELITYAWPCGNYFPEYRNWIAPYYDFARGYHINQIESGNPGNFWNYKSINSAGFGNSPPDYFVLADVTENYRGWINYVYHDTCNNPEIFEYLKTKSIWVDTIGTVSKYIKERQDATIQNIRNTPTGVKFDLVSTLDADVFNKDLTLKIYPAGGSVKNIKVNGIKVKFAWFSTNNQRYIKFDVPPGMNNTIEISGVNMNLPFAGMEN